MKILIIGRYHETNPKAFGGDVHVQRVAMELAVMGHEVFFVNTDVEQEGNPRYVKMKYFRVRGTALFPNPKQLASLMDKEDFDLVHTFSTTGFSMVRIKKTIPWVHSQLSSRMMPLGIKSPIGFIAKLKPFRMMAWYMERKACQSSDRVIVASKAMARIVAREYEVPLDKIAIVPRGVDIDRFTPSPLPSEPIILTVCRLEEEKGVQFVIEAMPIILREVPSAKLVVVGSGPYEQALRDKVHEMNLEDHVMFKGRVAHEALPKVYSCCRVFILCSTFEPFGAVILEAMASARPVVATRAGGPSEIVIDGVTGYLVEPRDVNSIASRLIELLKDYEKAERMGRAGRRRVESLFTWRREAELIARIYEELLSSK
ncbi:MAG: hypothetical protein DRN15_07875 [Thermoprotei archaeon]|nr:MAG: hypothetical protein DRM97_06625 [Thermoprotei archaeon]RLF22855.1 MAG: hypothetical protein DRN15_07875 [Thermoprotei archaeon]